MGFGQLGAKTSSPVNEVCMPGLKVTTENIVLQDLGTKGKELAVEIPVIEVTASIS